MIESFLMVAGSLFTVGVPIAGTLVIWVLFVRALPYARSHFFPHVGWTSRDRSFRMISLSLTPWFFAMAGILSAGASLTFEIIFAGMLAFSGLSTEVSGLALVVSAGPIEETAKWIVALGLFLLLGAVLGYHGPRDRVKDGILVGMFVGCAFGFLESVGYLAIGVSGLIGDGISYATLDPVVWRVVLGVFLHGVYTAIASVGLGRSIKGAVLWTLFGRTSAIMLHALNNGIQGYIVLVLGEEGTSYMILIDALQAGLLISALIILAAVWISRGKKNYGSRT